MSGLEILFKLLFAHALADFVLQPETMARGKNRHNSIHATKGSNFPRWYYWLTAHSLVHGGMVYLMTGSLALGVLETCLHWGIDFAKNEDLLNFNQDQLLHIATKLAYVLAL